MKTAVNFLKDLVGKSQPLRFKACVSSRTENEFGDWLREIPRIEIHDHTRQDMEHHVRLKLTQHPKIMELPARRRRSYLEPIIDEIVRHAAGVFLWTYSVTEELEQALRDGKPIEKLHDILSTLPHSMADLYTHILQKINPNRRAKAYIMLELVLRAASPLSVLELCMITHVTERTITGKTNAWADNMSVPKIQDFVDPARLCRQILGACRSMVTIHPAHRHGRDPYSPPGSSNIQSKFTGTQMPHNSDSLDGELSEDHFSKNDLQTSVSSPSHESSDDEDLSEANTNDPGAEAVASSSALFARQRSQDKSTFGDAVMLAGTAILPPVTENKRERVSARHLDNMFAERSVPRHHGDARELMYRAQFRDYHGGDVIDPTKDVVRLFHRSAVLFHAPRAEATLDSKELAAFFEILDDIDENLSVQSPRKECWPQTWAERLANTELPGWRFTFARFAVVQRMSSISWSERKQKNALRSSRTWKAGRHYTGRLSQQLIFE